ncbi:hypothetical protein [Calothrix sp. PCC 7507]|uniref:hypothetical protein n=1 Tax=Calothrix sp. PCC 7507 TaxID=99598 RepID=UPI00029F45DF|nr:hypothetical protein [Calothrix sp. PCC 7507]AFY35301.1 hypothetical protein Cal7507_4950 [Calothrix sp. PCC 7507]
MYFNAFFAKDAANWGKSQESTVNSQQLFPNPHWGYHPITLTLFGRVYFQESIKVYILAAGIDHPEAYNKCIQVHSVEIAGNYHP